MHAISHQYDFCNYRAGTMEICCDETAAGEGAKSDGDDMSTFVG